MTQLRKILAPLASLRLTVVLLVLAMFLVLAGTVAQRFAGNWEVVNAYFRSPFVVIPLHIFYPRDAVAHLLGEPITRFLDGVRFPFPGGLIIGGAMLLNLLAAHLVRFQLSSKRVGVLVLHAGIVLLLVGEGITALYAHESQMTIDEGSYANYTYDLRSAELALVDDSDPARDRHVVIPASLLAAAAASGQPITDPALPDGLELRVLKWMDNAAIAALRAAPPEVLKEGNPATQGFGTQAIAWPIARITGVEEQVVDAPTAYIQFTHAGKDLGTFLLSLHIDPPQTIEVNGKPFRMNIRFERHHKPYTMHLLDFRHDKFVGTDIPRNFSSHIRLVDPTRNEDREVLIYMNHPLRYAGETLYQSAFKPGDTATILQVVRNPGWLLPYIACVVVAVGMLIHFGAILAKFTGRVMG